MSAIGIPRVISAAGFVTTLGGGAMSARTRAAIDEAAQSNWRIDDLQAWAGGLIAEATGAEAGWVTSGAAAGLTLAAAACVAGTRLDAIDRLPDPGGVPAEIIVQRGHRNAYDRQLRNVGARLIEVGYPANEGIGSTLEWQLEAAFTDRTVAVAHLACAEHLGLPLERVCEIAHAHGVAVLVDAAAELPPRENLRRFTAAGADAVCFSGGKAIRGPQGAGLLATTHAIARSVRLQVLDMDVDARAWRAREGAEPPHHGLGRGFKVGPEEIAGLATALQEFAERDLDAEAADAAGWLATLPGEVVTDRGFWPQLAIAAGDRAEAIAAALAAADPAIVVPHARMRAGEIVITPEAIRPDDRDHVAATLRAALA